MTHSTAEGALQDNVAAAASRIDEAMRRARRHSSRVRFFKAALPVLAVVMVLGFAGRAWLLNPVGLPFELDGAAVEDGRLVMSNPKLEGVTREGRPYSMTARRASQEIGSTQSIDLEGIDAQLPVDAERRARVKAETGTFDREANTLEIDSPIEIETSDGMTALFQSALVDIKAGRMTTREPIRVELEGTRIEAETMTVEDGGGLIVLEKRVRVRIDPAQVRMTSAEGGGE
jgi:lipopolysaccharide export system protein LptC